MKLLTFPGGVHPEYNKEASLREPLREAALPDKVVIPLSQHIGSPNRAVVSKGDQVEEGQVIGESDAYISSPVHSSVPGTVKEIKKVFHPTLGPAESVIIEADKEKSAREYGKKDIENLTAEELAAIAKKAGIAGMGGAAFPTHVKLSVPRGKKIDTLIINGAECEPFLTCDHVLMTKKTLEILQGIRLLANAIQPERVYLAVEDNKKAAYFAFDKLINDSTRKDFRGVRLALLRTKYPQGGEKQLVQAITGREVPPGKLPLDVGCLVQNVGTVYALYEAAYFGKPLIERIVTISGDCLEHPGNYLVRLGTPLREIVDNYGIGLNKDPEKVIFGGPMMGVTQPEMDAPVIKSTSGILFLSSGYVKEYEEDECIKCAKCVDVCPVNLSPTTIMKNAKLNRWDRMEDLWVNDCMECGACAYECPARIPLVHYIKEGKAAVSRARKKK